MLFSTKKRRSGPMTICWWWRTPINLRLLLSPPPHCWCAVSNELLWTIWSKQSSLFLLALIERLLFQHQVASCLTSSLGCLVINDANEPLNRGVECRLNDCSDIWWYTRGITNDCGSLLPQGCCSWCLGGQSYLLSLTAASLLGSGERLWSMPRWCKHQPFDIWDFVV